MPFVKTSRARGKPSTRKIGRPSKAKTPRRVAQRSSTKPRSKPARKYLSPAMLDVLIRESPTPAIANEGPAKPPFDLQED